MFSDANTLLIYISTVVLSCLLSIIANKYNRRAMEIVVTNDTERLFSKYRRNELVWVLISIIPYILLAALRVNTGADYLQYTWNYSKIVSNPTIGVALAASEPGYMLSMWICTKILGTDPQWWIAFMAIITNTLVFVSLYRINRRINYAVYSMMFGFYAYFHSFNYVRQMLAAALLFVAFERMHNKHIKEAVVFMILAISFHRSSIIIAMLFWLGRFLKRYRSIYNLAAIVGLCGIVIAFPRILPLVPFLSRYEKYTEATFSGGIGWTIDIIPLFICTLLSLNMKKDEVVSDCIQLVLFSIPVRLMSYYTYAAGRLFITISLYSFLCSSLTVNKRRDRVVVKAIYVFIYGAYFYWYFYLGNNSMVFPYNSIL